MSVPGPKGEIVSSCIRDRAGNHVCFTNAGRTSLLMKDLDLLIPPKTVIGKRAGRTR